MDNSEATILLAEKRICFQTEFFRSYLTSININSGTKYDSIIKFLDNTLSPQKSNFLTFEEKFCVIFLPLVGAVEITSTDGTKMLNSGEIAYFLVREKEEIIIQNPYENDFVNYLEIWIKSPSVSFRMPLFRDFNIELNRNKLIEVSFQRIKHKVLIGKFDGRENGFLDEVNDAFVFVINGVFEINNRLLESRDGLLLINSNEIDFEGLGAENIILIIAK